MSLADHGQRDRAESLTIIASHINHCLAHRHHHLALVCHREECHRGGCGGQGRITLPSRHATVAPEAGRQVGGAAGHPLTDGTLLPLLLSKAPHLTSLSPRQKREWPLQHSSSSLPTSHLNPFSRCRYSTPPLPKSLQIHFKNWSLCLPAQPPSIHIKSRHNT